MGLIKGLHRNSTDKRLSFDEKVTRLLHIGTEVLGLETGIVSHIYNGKYEVVHLVSPNLDIETGTEFMLANTYCADTVTANDIVAYHNIDVSPGSSHPCYSIYALKSYLAIPIRIDGELYGTLNFSSVTPRETPFTSLDCDYILLLADWIGAEIARQSSLQEMIEQKKKLEEQNALLNQITELAGVGTWELDYQTKTVYWSNSLRRIMHLREDQEVTLKSILGYISSAKARKHYETKFIQMAETGEDWTYELEVINEIGETRWLESRAHPIFKDGRCVKIIGATCDITERVHTTQTLRHKTELAEQALKARSEFLANMSHEIRTPIHGVQGMLEALSTTSLSTHQKEYMHVAMRSADSLLNIVNDILDFSKIDAGHMMYEEAPMCIKQIIDQQTPMFRKLAEQKGLDFIIDMVGLNDKLFVGDSLRINQIIINLVNNAMKFTKAGQVKIKATCSSLSGVLSGEHSRGRYKVELTVSDTGIGISQAQQDTIFAPFLQAEESTQRRFGGTGLGLAIVSKIVAHYNGTIKIDSQLGKGATFIVTLILESADVGALSDKKANESNALMLGKKELAESRVLVVEDNEINQIVIKEQLKGIGVKVDLAENGKLGVEKLLLSIHKGEPYDLILMDYHMPVQDGLSATKEIRKLGGIGKSIPIIALTANALAGEKEKCLEAGMTDFLSKPVGATRLGNCISFHLAHANKTRGRELI